LADHRPFGAPARVYEALDIVRRVCALGDYDSNVIGMAAEIIAESVYGMEKKSRGSRDIDGSWFCSQDRRTVQVKAWSEARVKRYRHGTFFRVDEASGADELLVLLVYSSKVGYEELYKGPTRAIGKLEKAGLKRAIRFDSLKSREAIAAMLGPEK
jgi:hypothetical protein